MTFRTNFVSFVLLTLTIAGVACSHNDATTPTSPSAAAQSAVPSTLTGQVLDAGTNPIASAALTLVDSSGNVTTTTANGSGTFSFANLSAGTYSLQVVAPGYVTSISSLSVPVGSFTVHLIPVGFTPPVTTLTVQINGPSTLATGHTVQLTALVVYTDGTKKDVTNVAKWTSSNPAAATVSSSGVMTAYTPTAISITATFQDVSGTLAVTITP